jgi:hypothetical protein
VATADEMIDFPERGEGHLLAAARPLAERNAHYYLPVTKGISVTVCADPRASPSSCPR